MSDPVLNRSAPRQIPVARPWIGPHERAYVNRVLESGWLSSGPAVERFERAIAGAHGAAHGVACNSGTTALHLALRAAGVRPGSIVLLPTLTMVAVANAILYCGGRPVFLDSDSFDGNPCCHEIERFGPLAQACMVPHLYGSVARRACQSARQVSGGLWIIQDCAEAHYADMPPTDQMTLLTWSFYANKIVTCGEGGMVATQDPELAIRLRGLRAHAFTPGDHFTHQELAYGYRMTDLQAAVGLAQHERRHEIQRERVRVAGRYADLLQVLAWLQPLIMFGASSHQAWWVYPVLASSEEKMHQARRTLADAGVETRRFFRPLHTQPHLREFVRPGQQFPVARDLYERGFYLPLYPELQDDEIQYIADVLRAI